jgi:hypothetical protein
MNGYIWDVSNVVVGSTHDLTLFRATNISTRLSTHYKLLADKGYIAQDTNDTLITPIKKPANRDLSEAENDINKQISKHRVIVENAFHMLKSWAILGRTYRQNRTDLYQASNIVSIVAALYNLRFPRVHLRDE